MGGLSPSIENDANTLYGVSLELSRLDSALCADEAGLQAQIESCRTEQTELNISIEEAEVQFVQCNIRRQAADDSLTLHDAEDAKLLARESTLQTDESVAKQAVETSKIQSRENAARELAAVRKLRQASDLQIQEAIDSGHSSLAACAKNHDDIEKSINKNKTDELDRIQLAIQQADTSKDQQLSTLAKEKRQALSDNGVDTAMLTGIDTEISEQKQKISTAKSWVERVTTWRFWHENELPKRGQQDELAKASRKEQQILKGKMNTLSSHWLIRQQEIQTKLREIEILLYDLGQFQTQIGNKTAQLSDYPAAPEIEKHAFDASWTVAHLFGQAINLFSNRKAFHADLVSRVRKIKASFSSVYGSPTEQYFSTTRASVDPDDSNPAAWVKPLHDWFSREHESRRHILMMQASTYGSLISEFHDKLLKFHKEVGRFNNDIQKALNQTNVFRRISSITIHFDSALETLKYWNDVVEFNAIHKNWALSSREMPPPEFAEGLKRLVSHWEVREGIRAERRKLINIRGEVIENGNLKAFRTTADLEKLSSNGLSYLILCTIFVAFIRKIRGEASVQITWSVDEILDLDSANIHELLVMLKQNGIRLFSACLEANLDILTQFEKLYRVERNGGHPEIVEFVIDMGGMDV